MKEFSGCTYVNKHVVCVHVSVCVCVRVANALCGPISVVIHSYSDDCIMSFGEQNLSISFSCGLWVSQTLLRAYVCT